MQDPRQIIAALLAQAQMQKPGQNPQPMGGLLGMMGGPR